MRPSSWLLVVLAAGCGVDAIPLRQATPDVSPSRPSSDRSPSRLPEGVECAVDDDCELVPIVTCCDECPPVPPFESVARAAIDTLLLETEERCLRDLRPCAALPRCEAPPPGCVARPRCEAGRCTFDAVGCGRPVA